MTIEEAHKSGIATAHAAFERATGKRYMLHTHRMFAWEKFLVSRRFTTADMEAVVTYLQSEINGGRNYKPALWFANLIENLDKFEEYLNDATAKARNAPAPRTDRNSVLASTGRRPTEESSRIISMNERVQWHLLQMRKAAK